MRATFASFVVSDASRLAWQAARDIAEGRLRGPLVLCGPTGSGKTHLLRAIAEETGWRVMSAEELRAEVVEAIRRDGPLPVPAAAMLVDDVSAGHPHANEAFARLAAEVVARGHAAVMTALAPPPIENAIVAELRYPGVETRIEIARREAALRGLTLGDDALRALAIQCSGNPRELQSAIARLALTRVAPNATPSTARRSS